MHVAVAIQSGVKLPCRVMCARSVYPNRRLPGPVVKNVQMPGEGPVRLKKSVSARSRSGLVLTIYCPVVSGINV